MAAGTLTLVSDRITNRLAYVGNTLSERLGIPVSVVDQDAEMPREGAVVYYGSTPVAGGVSVFAAGLLSETAIRDHEPPIVRVNGQVMLYPAPEGFSLPFDLFSALFYLLSRYEEYLPFKPDPHGRFEADQSLAWRNNFLDQPVTDQWIMAFSGLLNTHFPDLELHAPAFSVHSTIDIDTPWAFRHKGFFRSLAILGKRLVLLNFRDFRLALRVMTGRERDPFDTYDFIRDVNQRNGHPMTWFFLSGDTGGADGNYALVSGAFRKLVEGIRAESRVGIHFSCRSNRSEIIRKKEYDRFVKYTGLRPDLNRQHFVLLSFPETYRQLHGLGIREDYTMGYASANGFRAGTSRSFRFYDIISDAETQLVIYPFIVMDVTCKKYHGLSPDEALAEINTLKERVRAVNGTFTTLWHNESLSEWGGWEGWRRVFEEGTRDEGQGTRGNG
jgi:hypothetical protein